MGLSHALFLVAVRVNETDTFADEEGLNDEYFDFEDISGKHQLGFWLDWWRFTVYSVVYISFCIRPLRQLALTRPW